jgi:hypothetical protein
VAARLTAIIRKKNIASYKFIIRLFVPQTRPVSQSTYNLRGHSRRLDTQRVKNCADRQIFFTNRVVAHWNALTQEAVDASTVNTFKDLIELGA